MHLFDCLATYDAPTTDFTSNLILDINECTTTDKEYTHNCTAAKANRDVCRNTNGSFECDCNGGYRLNMTSNTCEGEIKSSMQALYWISSR